MMQGLHQQQQQLAALLSVVFKKDSSSFTPSSASAASTAASSSPAPSSGGGGDVDESNRVAALNSLHRFILYPPNSVVVAHSATFLCQGLFQLLSDNSHTVRRSAATTYGALCSVLCSVILGSSGRHNQALLTSIVDRFISWALPLLRINNATYGSIELALEGICEFLSVGDAGAIERYSFPALKACQELLEDERTSITLLHQLLGVLTVISLKFFRSFQPHFLDIVDLLLGWAMVPDIAESDTRAIIGSFMQFQNHWVVNLQFPLGLLLKFLGDMDVLLQDGNPGTPQQFRRLVALLSCFSTVLQSTASGMLELNLLGQIIEPLNKMIPMLLGCLSMVGKKFGWSKWNEDLWRCLTLLAEILGDKFSNFYPLAVDILFKILDTKNAGVLGGGNITSTQVHGVLKTNLQLLSLQKHGLLSSSVRRILQFDSPISQLRLHPNHLVTASSAATYIFLLQHGNSEVVECAINCLLEELILLRDMLETLTTYGNPKKSPLNAELYSRLELLALFSFDLKVLPSAVFLGQSGSLIDHPDMVRISLKRSEKVVSFIILKLNPVNTPVRNWMEWQLCVFEGLKRLASAEFLRKCSIQENIDKIDSLPQSNDDRVNDNRVNHRLFVVTLEHLSKYSPLIVKGLELSSPLAVKLKGLDWIHQFTEEFLTVYENSGVFINPSEDLGFGKIVCALIFSVLNAALDGEPKVRSQAAVVSEMLLRSKLVHPAHLYQIGEVILEKLGDPDAKIRLAFVRLLANILPVAIYLHGQSNEVPFVSTICKSGCIPDLHWKQIFALKQLPQHIHAQQLVSVLGFISQRWKMPLSSWIERLIYSCQSVKEPTHVSAEETESPGVNSLWIDMKSEKDLLESISSVNHLAGVWWAINEAARYCTSTRLRTNLGGPTQSFAALERMLLDVAHVLQIDAEQSDGSLSIIGSSGAHLLPMRLVLDFVEALKKNVYNAYDGSTVLPCASRQSYLFFRANKKVCEEWFSRICEPMMNAALALQYHDATFHYCSLRLQELRCCLASSLNDNSLHSIGSRLLGDFIRVVRHMALALCKKREPDMLIGLQKWVHNTFSSFFSEEKQIPGSNEIAGTLLWINGLLYEANGQYEKSAAFFAHLLQGEESLNSMGADGIQFAISSIIQGYTATSDWKSLEAWLSELQSLRSKHAGKSYSGALNTAGNEMNAIHAMAHFDEHNLPAAWASLDLTPKSSCELTLDPKLALRRSEQMLLQALLYQCEGELEKLPRETQRAKLMLDEVLTVLPLDGMLEATPYATQLHCIYTLEEVYRLNKTESTKQLDSSTNLISQALRNKINQDCNSWLKLFRVYRTISPSSSTTLRLCKSIMTLARKQGNLELAYRLQSYLKDHIHSCSEVTCRSFLTSSLQYEEILMMHAENKLVDAVTEMWSFVRPCLISSEDPKCAGLDDYLKAKACLKLSTWIRQGRSSLNLESIVPKIYKDFNLVDDRDLYSLEWISASGSSTNHMLEELVGAALKLSTRMYPAMGKSWISYASWCFGQAKDVLYSSHGNVLSSFSPFSIICPGTMPQKFTFTKDEISLVESTISTLLQEICSGNDSSLKEWNVWKESCNDLDAVNPVNSLLQQVVAVLEAAAGAPGADDFDGQSLSTYVVSQLQIAFLSKLNVEEAMLSSSLDSLVNVWWSLRRRRVSMFGQAAHGFIQFLCHSSSKLCNNPRTALNFGSVSQSSVSLTLRATLFILHILLNYGVELKDMLKPVLSSVPLSPWQELTPQLFARLSSHSEPVIRKQLEGLLMMLAKLAPRSVVYPTLVDINTSDEEPPEELQHILDCLMKHYPRLVQDVRLMMHELGNVTVLWEELWLSTLQDLHGDVMRRLNLLKEEAARIADNNTLSHIEKCKISAARYSAMMAPIFVVLERRLALTSRKPETPHEKWFQEEYQEQLKSAISVFKSPPVSGAPLGEVWHTFDTIATSLASYQRKSSVSLQEVAPQLACLSSSDVPMPGLEKQVVAFESSKGLTTSTQEITTIASFSEHVSILPTKTKPKKLVMLGSDGENYTYLLKGREDLRLDARIMQLLEAVNNILHSSSETKGHSVGIRYYSVTPISGCAGLIQWVDNVISIYSVFKSWQQRIHQTQLSAAAGGNRDSNAPSVPRPSDMFYGKIIPALKEKGIRRAISRRDWPHDVKRKVLLELMEETPKQLLHQELWCVSEDFKAFSSKLKRYSGSLAAMSVVGHILGLGDRHLDNILMDFVSGDIVHIDYNVSFDKGQRLKVPEIVPFRLTQTLEAALGLTGVEGQFRANCESVLGVLRKNKDILLMLLEVFVWDPLVEWTRGDFHDDAALGGEERKGMELAVSLSLFASHVQEIRIPLQEHHDLLLEAIPSVESALKRFMDALNQYEVVYALFYRVDQERSALLIHETTAKSLVAEITTSSEKAHTFYEMQVQEFGQAKSLVIEKTQEATTWIEQHGRVIDSLRSGSLPEFKISIKLNDVQNALTLISAVSAAGVPLTIVPEPTQAQCYDIDREISQIMAELDLGVSSAVTSLQAYSLALQRVLPLNYLTTSPMHGWAQVLQICTNTISSDTLSRARKQATELIARGNRDFLDSVSLSLDDLCHKVENYALEIRNLEEECSELVGSVGCEAESNAKDHLRSALMKYMQSAGFARKEEPTSSFLSIQVNPVGAMDAKAHGDLDIKKKVQSILYAAICSLYDEAKCKVIEILNNMTGVESSKFGPRSDFEGIFCELEEHIEKCILLEEFVHELRQLIDGEMISSDKVQSLQMPASRCWASILKAALLSCKDLFTQMTDAVMPDLISCTLSSHSEVMDAFGSLSQIRGAVETALEQLVQIELERESLADLEKSYFLEVGLVTQQQLALEEAAIKGRDQLSWEDAEELASQEESCRAQLNQLHHTWNQKNIRASSLTKKEAAMKSALGTSERHFLSLLNTQDENLLNIRKGTAFLSILAKPFAVLESVDKTLSTYCAQVHFSPSDISVLVNCLSSGRQISEHVWRFKGLLDGHSFFVWKVGIVDSVLDLIIHDVPSSIDQNMSFEQLTSAVKKKLVTHLNAIMASYLKGQIAPAMLNWLKRAVECYEQEIAGIKELGLEKSRNDSPAIRKVRMMLEEYCSAHETVRAAKSASSLMGKQIVDLKEVIRKTSLEIVQTEWMRDVTSATLHRSKVISQKFFEEDDRLHPLLNLSRPKLLEALQSAVSLISRSRESLQSYEMNSATAEGQLERAMNWACGGPTPGVSGSTSTKGAGTPPEFHNHLTHRRQLLQETQEKAKDVIQLCLIVLEFEASRDGYLGSYEEITQNRTDGDCRTWQQNYLNALMRLDVSFHSYSRAEKEWKIAQSKVESASNSLFSASNELQIASVKAKSASGDLQNTLLQMKDCACETSFALSAFNRAMKLHTALTSECGSMLEEVLAISGLHDVLNLGKEAASVHCSLLEELSKASAILLPLESMLSKDVSTMTDAMARERETNSEISPIHGQAICQSYSLRIREACQSYKPSVPLLMLLVKELYSLLTKLAQTASLRAGNLHKALEGLRELEETRSQEINLSTADITGDNPQYENVDGAIFPALNGEGYDKTLGGNQLSRKERGWISPPESIYSSTSDSGSLTGDANSSNSFNCLEAIDQLSLYSNNDEAVENVVQFSEIHDGATHIQAPETSTVDDNYSEFSGEPSEYKKDIGFLNDSVPPIDLFKEANTDGMLQGTNEVSSCRTEVENENQNDQLPAKDGRVARGKNAFAMSVLRRIEMKIDGRYTDESREISTSEQVDYLLKLATSVDNLCNMLDTMDLTLYDSDTLSDLDASCLDKDLVHLLGFDTLKSCQELVPMKDTIDRRANNIFSLALQRRKIYM
ncbi:LOW QUALITY PROTEIN: hypothetical protein V2J09_016596 [Rumex salicifolius]